MEGVPLGREASHQAVRLEEEDLGTCRLVAQGVEVPSLVLFHPVGEVQTSFGLA